MVTEDFSPEHISSLQYRESRNRSRLVAFAIALFIHAVGIGGFLFVVLERPATNDVELIVAVAPAEIEQEIQQKNFSSNFHSPEPAPASAPLNRVIVVKDVSPVAVVETEIPVDLEGMGTTWGSGWGTGGMGGSGKGVQFFGQHGGGRSIILVIDVSTSMTRELGPKGIKVLKKEINRTVHSIGANRRFNLICFGNQADAFAEKPVVATAAMKKKAVSFMEDYFSGEFTRTRTGDFGSQGEVNGIRYIPIYPNDFSSLEGSSGGSRYDLALTAAFSQKANTIFLLTDGQPSTRMGGNTLSKNELIELVVNNAKSNYKVSLPKVNGVSVNGIGSSYLKEITKAFRGSFRNLKASDL